jgi:hypothetical protein
LPAGGSVSSEEIGQNVAEEYWERSSTKKEKVPSFQPAQSYPEKRMDSRVEKHISNFSLMLGGKEIDSDRGDGTPSFHPP